jgi:GT2 family glycosyltransferase
VLCNSSYPEAEQKNIKRLLGGCTIVFQDNVGFARAVNKGIHLASGEFILLFNPDAELIDNSLGSAIDFMKENNSVAVIGPKILDHENQIQDSCREFMTLGILFKRMLSRMLNRSSGPVLEKRDYSVAVRVDWVSGACMLVRRTAIDQVGLMDDRYFMYVEDMDWCRSFNKNGWQVWYFPKWCVEHNAGRASSGGVPFFNRLMWIHIASLIKYNIKWLHDK